MKINKINWFEIFKAILLVAVIITLVFSSLSPEDEYKEEFIESIMKKSTFDAVYTFSPDGKYVMLSTCSYVYKNARYMLSGVLEEL